MNLPPRVICGALSWLIAVTACGTEPETDSTGAVDAPSASTAAVLTRAPAKGGVVATAEGDDGSTYRVADCDRPAGTQASEEAAGFSVTRLDPDDIERWTRSTTGKGDPRAQAIATGPGSTCVVTGMFDGTLVFQTSSRGEVRLRAIGLVDFFLAAYDGDGELRWVRRVGATGEPHAHVEGLRVAVATDGCCHVAGNMRGIATFGASEEGETTLTSAGQSRLFVARYLEDGTLAWARQADGQIDAEHGAALASCADGSCVVVGHIRGKAAFGRGEAGEITLDSGARRGLFVACYGNDGRLTWAQSAAGEGSIGGQDVAAWPDGSCVVTGWLLGAVAFTGDPQPVAALAPGRVAAFVARYGTRGRLLWVRTVGGTGDEWSEGHGVTAQADGSCAVTGQYGGTLQLQVRSGQPFHLRADGDEETYLLQLDAEGAFICPRPGPRGP